MVASPVHSHLGLLDVSIDHFYCHYHWYCLLTDYNLELRHSVNNIYTQRSCLVVIKNSSILSLAFYKYVLLVLNIHPSSHIV